MKCLFEFFLISAFYDVLRAKKRLGWIWDVAYYGLVFVFLKAVFYLSRETSFSEWIGLEQMVGANYLGFCMGVLTRKYQRVEALMDRNSIFTLSFLVFAILFAFYIKGYKLSVFSLLMSLCGVSSAVYVIRHSLVEGSRMSELISFLGKHSLEIYIIHFFFPVRIVALGAYTLSLIQCENWRSVLWGINCQLITAALISMIVIPLSLIIMKILRASDILSLLLLGRKN